MCDVLLYSACAGDITQQYGSVYKLLLGDDNVVRDATIDEMSQAVFSASPLRGYIIQLIKLN
jgi:hypothetical protein